MKIVRGCVNVKTHVRPEHGFVDVPGEERGRGQHGGVGGGHHGRAHGAKAEEGHDLPDFYMSFADV